MELGPVRRALFALYQISVLGERALARGTTTELPEQLLPILEEIACRLRSLQGAAVEVEAGAAIATHLSSANPTELLQGCTGLRTVLTGPDFGLALSLAPSVREIEASLVAAAQRLSEVVEGRGVHRLSLPSSVRRMAYTAQVLEQQPVALREILTVMQRRRHLLIPETEVSIHTGNPGRHTIADIFSGRLEKSVPPAVKNGRGGADSVALGSIAHALYSMRPATNMLTAVEISSGTLGPPINSILDFSEHPLLQLGVLSYMEPTFFPQWLQGPAFNEAGFLAARRSAWEWAARRPPIEILT